MRVPLICALLAGLAFAQAPSDDARPLAAGTHADEVTSDAHWYRIDADAGSVVRVTMGLVHADGDLDMFLYDEVGGLLASSTSVTDHEQAIAPVLGGGTFLKVTGTPNRYQLEVAIDPLPTLAAGLHEGLRAEGEAWFLFEVPDNSLVRVKATFSTDDGDLDLELRSLDNTGELDSSRGTSDVEEIAHPIIEGGTLLLRAYNATLDFSLELATEPIVTLEPGLHEGLTCSGTSWFRVTAPPRADVDVILRGGPDAGDLDLHLLDRRGWTLVGSTSFSADEQAAVLGPLDGILYARVRGPKGSFSLEVTNGEPIPADRFEPNDDVYTAAWLETGSYTDLLLLGEDNYRVAVPEGRAIEVRLDFKHSRGDIDCELYSSDGVLLQRAAGGADTEHLRFYTPGGPQEYHLRVYNAYYLYNLHIETPVWEAEDRFEPNELVGFAAAIEPGFYEDLVCTGQDWYKVELEAGQELQVAIDFEHAAGDLELAITDEDGWQLTSSTSSEDGESCVWQTDVPATVHVQVYAVGNRLSRNGYTLRLAQGRGVSDPVAKQLAEKVLYDPRVSLQIFADADAAGDILLNATIADLREEETEDGTRLVLTSAAFLLAESAHRLVFHLEGETFVGVALQEELDGDWRTVPEVFSFRPAGRSGFLSSEGQLIFQSRGLVRRGTAAPAPATLIFRSFAVDQGSDPADVSWR